MDTARSNRSPVVGMGFNLNDIVAGQQMSSGRTALQTKFGRISGGVSHIK
jgi:hypothetical protein